MLNHVDLFSGIGGFALAARWSGFRTIYFCEKDKFCQQVLIKNFPGIPIFPEVKTFTTSNKVDLITGGFPCQPFSIAGKQKGRQDDRYLWPEFLRIIRECNPSWIVAENVAGIVAMELDNIINDLENEAYEVQAFIIPASAASAPHRRERVWIVAHANGVRCKSGVDSVTPRTSFSNFNWNIEAAQKVWNDLFYESWKAFDFKNWFESPANTNGIGCSKKSANQSTFAERFKRSRDFTETIFAGPPHEGKENEPPIPGMDDGLPNGVDRNKSLGNAIVPQVVYPILKFIFDFEMSINEQAA